jgi:tetratricopeptide (TPR) repeat protein
LVITRSGKYEEALEKFESVLGLKPEIDEVSVASYNVACCYAKLNQVAISLFKLCKYIKTKVSF